VKLFLTKKRKNEDLYSIPGVHEVRKPIWGSGTTSYIIDYRKKRKIKTFGKIFIGLCLIFLVIGFLGYAYQQGFFKALGVQPQTTPIKEIIINPNKYIGIEVTVKGILDKNPYIGIWINIHPEPSMIILKNQEGDFLYLYNFPTQKIPEFGETYRVKGKIIELIKKAPWEKTGSRYGVGIQIISIEKL